MRRLATATAALAALLTLGGFAGALHPAADTLALARPVFAVLALTGALVAPRRSWRLGFAALGIAALATLAPALRPQPAGGDIRIYSKNLWAPNDDPARVVSDIEAAGVDAVFLQEVSRWNDTVLGLLAPQFPHQKFCRFSGWGGVAVASRLPFDGDGLCSREQGLAAAPVRIAGDRVWLASVHIPWHWPVESVSNENAVLAVLDRLDAPAVVAGDFNSFPWTSRVRRIAAARDNRPAGPVRPTLFVRHLPLPIDMAFAPGGGRLERRPQLGSDHYGIVADLALTR